MASSVHAIVANEGNTVMRYSGSIEVRDTTGNTVQSLSVGSSAILRESERDISVKMPDLPKGYYVLLLLLKDSRGGLLTGTTTVRGAVVRWLSAPIVSLWRSAWRGSCGSQTIHCVPPKDCSNGVQFLPTQAEYAAAVGGALSPTSPTSPIAFQVLQDKKNAYSLEVSRSPWSPPTPMTLEARITLSGPHIEPIVLDWAPISTIPVTLFTHDVNKTDVSVEYRLRIDGSEPPGTYTTTVTFHAWDANGPPSHGNKVRDSVTTTITVTIPSYVSLLLDGCAGGADGER